MSQLIWVEPGNGEPAWATGGTYVIVRTIRMHVEFWDRVGMLEQEQMIGRDRVTGAPLGGTDEFQDPRYDLDPQGKRIPLNAHIRMANPRTPATADQRILRRGYNYHRGVDEAGDLDQGLVFVAFNQDPERQFATIQRRLDTEPMIDYITPVGGGYFFAPRGTRGRVGLGRVGAGGGLTGRVCAVSRRRAVTSGRGRPPTPVTIRSQAVYRSIRPDPRGGSEKSDTAGAHRGEAAG